MLLVGVAAMDFCVTWITPLQTNRCQPAHRTADAAIGTTPLTNGNRPFTPRSPRAPTLDAAAPGSAAHLERGTVRLVILLAVAAAATAAAVDSGRRGPRYACGGWLDPDPAVSRVGATIDGP